MSGFCLCFAPLACSSRTNTPGFDSHLAQNQSVPYRATARDGEAPVVSQADLLHGAQLQLRGALRMKDFDRRRIPTRGLEAVLLPKELKANLDKIVHHEKVGGFWYNIY